MSRKLRSAATTVLMAATAAFGWAADASAAADKSGTNPINFTNDLRIYNEFIWLNTPGDGVQNMTTVEFRTPFADGKWQFRVRARALNFEADLNGDGLDDVDEFGTGDTDFRFLTVPYLNMKKKMAIAVGIEAVLDTASEAALGAGATSFGPQVFGVFFKPFGGFWDLIAPAYQHKFSVEEDRGRAQVHQGLIDLFFLKMAKDKQSWMLVDPQAVIDYENDKEFMLIDMEAGKMLDKYLGTKGHSVYVRPSVGIGSDRPTDGSIEIGYKIIW